MQPRNLPSSPAPSSWTTSHSPAILARRAPSSPHRAARAPSAPGSLFGSTSTIFARTSVRQSSRTPPMGSPTITLPHRPASSRIAFASSSRVRIVVDRASRRVSRRRSRTCCMFRRRTLGRRASKCRHARAIGRDRTFRGRHDTRDCRLSHDSWIFAYKNSKLAKKEKNFEFWTRPDSDARATTGARRRRRTRARRGEGRGR